MDDDEAGGPSAWEWRRGLPRKRMAAASVLVDDDGRVILVRPTYRPGWDLPGGVVEQDEAPLAAARRELAEELGLDRAPGRLLARRVAACLAWPERAGSGRPGAPAGRRARW